MASGAPFRKLKPGPGLAADAVAADQRRRIHEAMIGLVIERGYERVTVRGLAELAGVSTHTFYGHYANLEQCFGYICDATLLGALHRAAALSTAGGSWEEAVRAGMRSLLEDVARQPAAARVALVDGFSAGPAIEARVSAAVRTFEQLLVDLMLAFGLRPVAPEMLIGGMVAGVIAVARKTTVVGRADELPGLADELSQWLLSLPREEVGELLQPPRPRAGAKQRREPEPFPGQAESTGAAIGDPRERVLRATAKLAQRDGFEGLDLPRIRAEAGVPRRQFDAGFGSAADAFLESIEWSATAAVRRAGNWALSEKTSRTHPEAVPRALRPGSSQRGPRPPGAGRNPRRRPRRHGAPRRADRDRRRAPLDHPPPGKTRREARRRSIAGCRLEHRRGRSHGRQDQAAAALGAALHLPRARARKRLYEAPSRLPSVEIDHVSIKNLIV